MKYIYTLVLCGICLFSCTSNFEEYNTNPIGISEIESDQDYNRIGSLFPQMEQMIYCNFNWGSGTDWTFQLMQNLNADIWSGYMASASNFAGGVNNQTYSLVAGWNDNAWDYTYAHLMPNSLKITKKTAGYEDLAHFEAVNKILKVLAMSRMSELYGPIIYSQYGASKTGGAYDSEKDLYNYFFKDLTDATVALEDYIKKNPTTKPFTNFDMAYAGDYAQWIKFANSLRLRLAMRIVKQDPILAQAQAEAAIAHAGGVLTVAKDNFTISGRGYKNPLAGTTSWRDISISANMESILSGYNDPRKEKMCTTLEKGTFTGQVKGVRTGIPNLDQFGDKYKDSISYPLINTTDAAILMTAAEVYFLRAEGDLRKWKMNGTAKDLYEAGVNVSFAQWKTESSTYLQSSNTPAPFVDQLQASILNSPAASSVSPKWEDANTDEERLEKIITQKWIAGFPEGYNAWSEFRRTGYPKLFPIVANNSQGVISTDLGVRRIPFSTAEVTNNPEGIADAIKKLNGPDNGATRLWWDVAKPNF